LVRAGLALEAVDVAVRGVVWVSSLGDCEKVAAGRADLVFAVQLDDAIY
jgi:hypothetical protein